MYPTATTFRMVLRRLDATSFGVDILVLLSDDLIAFVSLGVGLGPTKCGRMVYLSGSVEFKKMT